MILFLKRLFCKHEWVDYHLCADWLDNPCRHTAICTKCSKTKRI